MHGTQNIKIGSACQFLHAYEVIGQNVNQHVLNYTASHFMQTLALFKFSDSNYY